VPPSDAQARVDLENMAVDLSAGNLAVSLPEGSFSDTGHTLLKRFAYVLKRTPRYFKKAAKKQLDALKALWKFLTKPVVLIAIGVLLVAWLASHYFGVGFVIDAALLYITYALIGWTAFTFLSSMIKWLYSVYKADSLDDLEACAEKFADILATLSLEVLLIMSGFALAKIAKKAQGAAKGAKQAIDDAMDARRARKKAAAGGTQARVNSKSSEAFKDSSKHPGKHNDPDLRVEYKDYDWDNFETTRKIDMDNLSESDKIVRDKLRQQGRSPSEIEEVLSSSTGKSPKINDVKKGDKFYGFQDKNAPLKDGNNKYWLDEAGFKDVESKYFKDGAWDKQGVKNYLALPCSNSANTLTTGTATRADQALQTNIGKAVEILPYRNSQNALEEVLLELPGGGKQITPPKGLITVP